jgi:hypothetical protein
MSRGREGNPVRAHRWAELVTPFSLSIPDLGIFINKNNKKRLIYSASIYTYAPVTDNTQ